MTAWAQRVNNKRYKLYIIPRPGHLHRGNVCQCYPCRSRPIWRLAGGCSIMAVSHTTNQALRTLSVLISAQFGVWDTALIEYTPCIAPCIRNTIHSTLHSIDLVFKVYKKKSCKTITGRVSDDQDSEKKTVDLESFCFFNHNKSFPNSAGRGLDSLAF